MTRIWTAATGIEPVDPDSELGQRISRDLTRVCLEVRAEIAERRRVEALERQRGAA